MGVVFQRSGSCSWRSSCSRLVIAFQIVTLPVEFNASRRAMAQVRQLGLVSDTEAVGARQTLTAAAMTYVAGALASIAQLLYFLAIFGRN